MAGGQARGLEANRLLTLEHSGSGTPAQAGDDAAEATSSHPCPVLELPPAWPLGCGTEDVPAFCFVCFHKEEEEELLEGVALQRSVCVFRGGGGEGGRASAWPRRPALNSVHCLPLSAGSLSQTVRSSTWLLTTPSPLLSSSGPTVTFLSSPSVGTTTAQSPPWLPTPTG